MAHENVSPLQRQVNRTRPVIALSEDVDSDVAIVGGGISGVATSYFLLHDTSLSVVSEGLLAINGAWRLLYSIISETGITASLQEVMAHLGLLEVNMACSPKTGGPKKNLP